MIRKKLWLKRTGLTCERKNGVPRGHAVFSSRLTQCGKASTTKDAKVHEGKPVLLLPRGTRRIKLVTLQPHEAGRLPSCCRTSSMRPCALSIDTCAKAAPAG